MATEVQVALQPQAGQDPAAALTAAAAKLVRASLELLVQQAGQPMTGKIMAPLPGLPQGLSQISVADQVLTLKLSAPLPAGTPVRIDVQQTAAGQPTVIVQPVPTTLPAPSPAPGAPPPPTSLPMPAAAAQTPMSSAPQATLPLAAPTPAATSPAPAPAATPPAPAPAPAQPQSASSTVATPQAPSAPAAPPPVIATSAQVAPPAPVPSAPPIPAVPVQASPNPAAAIHPATVTTTPAAAPPAAPIAAAPAAAPATTTPQSIPQAPAAAPPLQAQVAPATLQPSAPVPTTPQSVAAAPVPGAPATAPQPQSPPPVGSPATPQMPVATAAPPQVLIQRLTQAFAPPPSASAPPPVPGSPAQVLLAATTQAAAQQLSPAPLLQALAVVLPQLPGPVAEAAARVLASRINLDRGAPAGEALKQAVLKSGVFVDAPAKAGSPPDTRQALTQLRGTLLAWLGDDIAPVAAIARRPPPPARGTVPRGQAPELPPQVEGGAREAGKSLLGQTEGALSRIKLMQLNAQPAEAVRPGGPMAAPGEWTLELPLMLGHELAMAQIQIGRDGNGKAEAKDKRWRLRFALKFSVLGEVGAQVSMVGARTSIAIWADEEATAETLEAMLPELAPSLAAKGLELVSLTVRRGVPKDETQPAGRLMDSVR